MDLSSVCPLTDEEVLAVKAYIKVSSALPPAPPRHPLPNLTLSSPIRTKLLNIQAYIDSLEYNHTGANYFNISKVRSLHSILATAKAITYEALPIKCVEATFLALYFTQPLNEVDRIPLAFKSEISGQIFKHIVCAVHYDGKFGALGISRRKDLMFKDLIFNNLGDLVSDFCTSYSRWFHKVLRVRIGLPVSHEPSTNSQVYWRCLRLNTQKHGLDLSTSCNRFFQDCRRLAAKWALSSQKIDCSKYIVSDADGSILAGGLFRSEQPQDDDDSDDGRSNDTSDDGKDDSPEQNDLVAQGAGLRAGKALQKSKERSSG
eukprot:TRINITY_DN8052_c0_g1::TRINITY_DN8052_c0_g1_i1::g.20159::m.20159 TRINITY_DN8052_c0_g1::TRINITY_DN8052_c0_g1_i1::g.20159  ORF type:complete len:317 (+),score=19.01,sp/Q86V25/VASH2_HUMAN/38.86/7e-49,Vasohibin/PF14822.1/1.1e-67 TRINITY_DN8052_c0_g1_i1:152-1102(+)